MAKRRVAQRGVIQMATAFMLAAFALLFVATGCSAGGEPGATEAAEATGEASQAAIACTCPASTACRTYPCTPPAGQTCASAATNVPDLKDCSDAAGAGVCVSGSCCRTCYRTGFVGYICAGQIDGNNCAPPATKCVSCSNAKNTCQLDICDPKGQCGVVDLKEGETCTDNSGACHNSECCAGCVDADGTCQLGDSTKYCGVSGTGGLVQCASCVDGESCTTDVCKEGSCVHGTVMDNTPCVDGDKCNGDEACKAGKCVGPANFSCDDMNVCTAESCDAVTGCAHAPLSNTSCADANKCNGDETCSNGSCQAGTALNCNDMNPCTTDGCNAGSGCTHAAKDGVACADANKCNGIEMCVTGTCTAGTALNCDDNNPCTADACDPATGCTHSTVSPGTKCDDGNVCNGISTCVGTVCTAGTALNCDDNNVCTNDSCDMATGCKYANNTLDCSDNDLCTTVDKCAAGKCVGSVPPNCDDNEDCTSDTCDAARGCQHAAVMDNTGCNDGNDCSTGDKCVGGKCKASGGKACDDANQCTQNTCDPNAGSMCVYPKEMDGTPCTYDKCHQNSTCQNSACTQGDPIDCDDNNPCTTDGCDAMTGCTHTPDNLAKCSDGDLCTNGDHCTKGVCIGTDVACAPLDECHEAGTCAAMTGVCDDPRAADNKPCKGGHCEVGKCIPDPNMGGAGGAPAEGGAGGEGVVPQGGDPTTGTAGDGPDQPSGGDTTGTGGTTGGTNTTGGKPNTGGDTAEGGEFERPEHPFVRTPGGCACRAAGHSSTSDVSWLVALAAAAAVVGRRRSRERVL